MANLGGVFGLIALYGVILLTIRLVVQTLIGLLRKGNKPLPETVKIINRAINRSHRVIGVITMLATIAHFIAQYSRFGFLPVAGLVAGLLMILQGVIGFALKAQKGQAARTQLRFAHLMLGFILVVAVLAHRLI